MAHSTWRSDGIIETATLLTLGFLTSLAILGLAAANYLSLQSTDTRSQATDPYGTCTLSGMVYNNGAYTCATATSCVKCNQGFWSAITNTQEILTNCPNYCQPQPTATPTPNPNASCEYGITDCTLIGRQNLYNSECTNCPSGFARCCGQAITLNCQPENNYCHNGYYYACKPDRSGYEQITCSPGLECLPGADRCTHIPTATPTPPASGPTCHYGITDCNDIGRQNLTNSSCTNCAVGYASCCGDALGDACTPDDNRCQNGKLLTCKPDRSGFATVTCGTGYQCLTGNDRCTKTPTPTPNNSPTPTPTTSSVNVGTCHYGVTNCNDIGRQNLSSSQCSNCATGYASCCGDALGDACTPDDNYCQAGLLYFCKIDRSGFTSTDCGPGTQCLPGANRCTPVSTTPTSPTPPPATPTPTPVSGSSGTCHYGVTNCNDIGRQNLSLNQCTNCASGYASCCGDPLESTCTQADNHCQAGLFYSCKPDQSGYDLRECGPGTQCLPGANRCTPVPTLTPTYLAGYPTSSTYDPLANIAATQLTGGITAASCSSGDHQCLAIAALNQCQTQAECDQANQDFFALTGTLLAGSTLAPALAAQAPLAAYVYATTTLQTAPAWVPTAVNITVAGTGLVGINQGIQVCHEDPSSTACAAFVAGVQLGFLDDVAQSTGALLDDAYQPLLKSISSGYTTSGSITSTNYVPNLVITADTPADEVTAIQQYLANLELASYRYSGNLGDAIPAATDPRVIFKTGMPADISGEVATLQAFSGSGVLPDFYGQIDETTYAMEFIPGMELPLSGNTPVTVQQINQAAEAYGDLIRLGFTNADLNPRNILVMPDGTIRLIDPLGYPSTGQVTQDIINMHVDEFMQEVLNYTDPIYINP